MNYRISKSQHVKHENKISNCHVKHYKCHIKHYQCQPVKLKRENRLFLLFLKIFCKLSIFETIKQHVSILKLDFEFPIELDFLKIEFPIELNFMMIKF